MPVCVGSEKYLQIFFCVHVTVHREKFLIIKPTRCTDLSNLFRNETVHVSDSSSAHHQELFTVHPAMVYVIKTAFEQQLDQDGTNFHPDPAARTLSTDLYDIYHC
jgi:UDP-N-acetylglucosamine 2-epimerase